MTSSVKGEDYILHQLLVSLLMSHSPSSWTNIGCTLPARPWVGKGEGEGQLKGGFRNLLSE